MDFKPFEIIFYMKYSYSELYELKKEHPSLIVRIDNFLRKYQYNFKKDEWTPITGNHNKRNF